MPQHWDEELQLTPWVPQLLPLEQTPPAQVAVPQHCEELVQEAPTPLQLEVPPMHTPPEQVEVPQHSEELAQRVPLPWQEPPLQTLLALQVSTPQQSPLDAQRWFCCWQGPVRLGSVGGSLPPPPQARVMETLMIRARDLIFIDYKLGRPARRGAGLPA